VVQHGIIKLIVMKKHQISFTVSDKNEKTRGEVITKAKSSNDATNQVIEALGKMNIKNVTIVSSNEIK